MTERLTLLYESFSLRDLAEIAVLSIAIYGILRCLGKARGSGMVRGLAIVVIGLFLVAQVIIASLDLTELGKVLDYMVTALAVGLVVVFQPELRRGLMVLGRYRWLRYLVKESYPIANKLAEVADILARDHVGALIVIQREMALTPYIETGVAIDGEITGGLIRSIFTPRTPLHDGAAIICKGKLTAAACQLPLSQPPDGARRHIGMRHRAAIGVSEDTDAVVLVVSEETGRISLAVGGQLEPVSRDDLAGQLRELLHADSADVATRRREARAA